MTGVSRRKSNFPIMTAAVKANVATEIVRGATMIQADAVESIQRGSKTGRTYTRGNVTHQASAPGEAPASDTGNLARRIDIEFSGDKLRADIGVHNLLFTPYARRLELGDVIGPVAPGAGRIAARPYMRPAYNKNIKAIQAAIAKAVKGGLS